MARIEVTIYERGISTSKVLSKEILPNEISRITEMIAEECWAVRMLSGEIFYVDRENYEILRKGR